MTGIRVVVVKVEGEPTNLRDALAEYRRTVKSQQRVNVADLAAAATEAEKVGPRTFRFSREDHERVELAVRRVLDSEPPLPARRVKS